jgi:hypothetical protein
MKDTATYSPEDNKLRLYVGRVPRDEYLALKAQGWTSTPKQDCDFVATWTVNRRDTCLKYADIIEDEDMGPEERAADRAERFGEYRDKRTGEATGHADRFDAGPHVHGFQSQARANRAASRHDRIGTRAVDSWSKAEYWQRRTAGVISHALHVSSPGVRMGRIKTIEAELRKERAEIEKRLRIFRAWEKIRAIEDPEKQTRIALAFTGSTCQWAEYPHPLGPTAFSRDGESSLYSLLSGVNLKSEEDIKPRPEKHTITGKEACDLFFSDHSEPQTDNEWTLHMELRLAYENQMIEAQGGRAASLDIEVGGFIGGKQIHKVNKSVKTGRVVSVHIRVPKVSGWTYQVENVPGTDYALMQYKTERLPQNAYRPPTEADKAALAALVKEKKDATPKKATIPLVNPTDEDAERLQTMLNNRIQDELLRKKHPQPFTATEVCRIKQATYSANSQGSYARAETRYLYHNGELSERESNMYSSEGEARRKARGPALAQVRVTYGSSYMAMAVIVLTDKPQKPFPAEVWESYTPPVEAKAEVIHA